MGLCPSSTNALLVWLKHRLPMKGAFVLVAPNGLGCDVRITTCLPPALIIDCNFSAAGAPQSSNTSPLSFFLASLAKTRITSSVKFSHPFFLWLFGSPFLTVMTELSINTPCLAQFSKYPCRGIPFLPGNATSGSLASSLYIFLSEGGIATPVRTEKHSPWACCGP